MAHAGSRREGKGAAAAILTGGVEGRRAWCGGGSKLVGRGRAGRAAALVSSIGRRRGEAPAVASVASSSGSSPPLLSLLLVQRRRQGVETRMARVLGGGRGVLMGRDPRACGAGPDTEGGDARRPCHGHAAAIRRLQRG
jgi:hypothetical protein